MGEALECFFFFLPRCFLLQVVKDTVNIQIGDVNDNAPTFHGQPYTVHIPEVSNQSTIISKALSQTGGFLNALHYQRETN